MKEHKEHEEREWVAGKVVRTNWLSLFSPHRMNPVRKELVKTPDDWPYQGVIHDIAWM